MISQARLVMDTFKSLESKSIPACNLCLKEVKDEYKRYLVDGRGQLNVLSELKSLDFNVANTSRYICRVCLDKLKKRRGLIRQLLNLEGELKRVHHEHSSNIHQLKRPGGNDVSTLNAKKQRESTAENQPMSSPVRQNALPLQWPISPVTPRLQQQNDCRATRRMPVSSQPAVQPSTVDVSVKVKWPSKPDKERKLPESLESLGKMLVRGTYRQIANAAWKNDAIRQELIELMARDVDKECTQLCSKKDPSCLRKTDKESMLSFTMEKVYEELKVKAPLLHCLLAAASTNRRSRSKAPQTEVLHAGTAMAAAICLRNRSKFMSAVQLLITIFLYHSNWLVSLKRHSVISIKEIHCTSIGFALYRE